MIFINKKQKTPPLSLCSSPHVNNTNSYSTIICVRSHFGSRATRDYEGFLYSHACAFPVVSAAHHVVDAIVDSDTGKELCPTHRRFDGTPMYKTNKRSLWRSGVLTGAAADGAATGAAADGAATGAAADGAATGAAADGAATGAAADGAATGAAADGAATGAATDGAPSAWSHVSIVR